MKKYGLLIILWIYMSSIIGQLQPYASRIDIRYTKSQLTREDIVSINEKEKQTDNPIARQIIGWDERLEQQITSKSLDKTISTCVIQVSSNIQEFVLNKGDIQGTYHVEREEGVVISSGLAYELWGSRDGVGERLIYEEIEYRVEGIIEEEEAWMIVHMPNHQDSYVSNLRLVGIDKNNIQGAVEQFEGRHDFEEGVIINYSTAIYVVNQFVYVIPIFFLIKGLVSFYRLCVELGSSRWIGSVCGGIGGIGVLNILLDILTKLPYDLIPNRWSDFSFWSERYSMYKGNIDKIERLTSTFMQEWFYKYIQQVVLVVGITVVIMCWHKRTPKSKDV